MLSVDNKTRLPFISPGATEKVADSLEVVTEESQEGLFLVVSYDVLGS